MFLSDRVGNLEDRFSHDTAHLMNILSEGVSGYALIFLYYEEGHKITVSENDPEVLGQTDLDKDCRHRSD